jgi:hypothetical protein
MRDPPLKLQGGEHCRVEAEESDGEKPRGQQLEQEEAIDSGLDGRVDDLFDETSVTEYD